LATNHVFLRCDGGVPPSEILATARGAGRTLSVYDDERKVIVLDELDTLNVTAQAKFRAVIDECGHNATFIATTNYIDSIIPALKSRLRPVCFDHDPGSVTLKSAWRQRLQAIYRAHFKCEIDESLLTKAILGYPDGRQMISTVTSRSIS
jgi:DNA polymerase III delta prime subunit